MVELIVSLCALGLIVSVPMILWRPWRSYGKKLAVVSFLGVISAGFIGQHIEDSDARSYGWADASTRKEAAMNGIYDSGEWADFLHDRSVKRLQQLRAIGEGKLLPVMAETSSRSLRPQEQSVLLTIVDQARFSFVSAKTEMQEGATKPWRATALCNNLKSLSAQNWLGTISKLTTNGEGKGVVSVSIGDEIEIQTWNNAASDIFHETLIEPGTALYNRLLELEVGDDVLVTGQFLGDETDCLRETSITIRGSMMSPEFLFKFHDIQKL